MRTLYAMASSMYRSQALMCARRYGVKHSKSLRAIAGTTVSVDHPRVRHGGKRRRTR